MKGKYAIALTALACIATWFIAWELYDTLQLWQTIPNMKYQNYVVLSIFVEAGLALLGYVYQKQKLQPQKIEVPKPPGEQDAPSEESSFIGLTARVNTLETEQHEMRRDIEQIRIFKTLCPQSETKEEANKQ